MKYIIIDNDFPIIFDEELSHKMVAGSMVPTSAGYLSIFENEIACHGESLELDISSNPEKDRLLIKRLFRTE